MLRIMPGAYVTGLIWVTVNSIIAEDKGGFNPSSQASISGSDDPTSIAQIYYKRFPCYRYPVAELVAVIVFRLPMRYILYKVSRFMTRSLSFRHRRLCGDLSAGASDLWLKRRDAAMEYSEQSSFTLWPRS